MPAKPSGEIKTRIIHNTRKNGDIYVIERHTIYDAEKKYNVVIDEKLISKIPKGSEVAVPTRPKKAKGEKEQNHTDSLVASRKHIGMMKIIDHIGDVSGIDDGIYSNTDLGTAQKLISIARYFLATNGQTLPGIIAWQFNHPLPYEDGISEGIYHELFAAVGRDEALQQNFFLSRCTEIKGKPVLAYDSTTVSTYSDNQIEARYGYNKAGDGLKTIKLLTLYSIETRQPIAFTKQPGNISDVVTIETALKQLAILGLGNAEIVTDNGYYSEHNLTEFFLSNFEFITLAKTSIVWIKPEIDNHRTDFESLASMCPFDTGIHGITLTLTRDFTKVYPNGEEKILSKEVYLNLYFNPVRKLEDDLSFDNDLFELKRTIEEGLNISDMSPSAQKKIEKYLYLNQEEGHIQITFNEKTCSEAKKYHGYFALVSNSEKNPFDCLYKYRKRETIESFFESMKQHVDGMRVRVWDTDTLRGRMFVQFIALCYYEYLSNEVRNLKDSLGIKNGDPVHDTEKNIKLEKKLKYWLNESPIYLILQWFDTVEGVDVSSKLLSKRWSTEITQRDKLFLDKLGVELSY